MPTLLVFAGPNGSGKSTVTSRAQKFGDYVNADMLKAELRCSDMEAAQLAEATREYLLKNRKDFTFETVLSTERNVSLMHRAKDCGYTVICIFVLTIDPAINIRRVEERVRRGGHDVPNVKIIKRYKGALKLIPQWLTACDEVYFFDNSKERSQGEPDMIASIINGSFPTIYTWKTKNVHLLSIILTIRKRLRLMFQKRLWTASVIYWIN